jgi:glycine oxidase
LPARRLVIVVVGAGIVGLCAAYELAKRGAKVHVVEAADSAASSSWMGAGMLAPFSDAASEEEEQFLTAALSLYQVFVKELHKRTGIDPFLRLDGIIEIACDEAGAMRLRDRAAALMDRGIHAHWFDAYEARDIEPAIGPEKLLGASLIEDEGQIDSRYLGRALRAACVDEGVILEEQTGPVSLETSANAAVGVRAGERFLLAETVVNAAGAWAGQLSGVPEHLRIPIVPVKAEMLSLDMPQRVLKRPTTIDGVYVIPRTDGSLLIGENAVDDGFDRDVDAAAIERLRAKAVRALPVLAELTVSETWAALRPRSPNLRPYIGRTELEGYYVAAGHYRHGILLAPTTALAIANVIEGSAV